MKPSIQRKLDKLTSRLAELNDLLSCESATSNLKCYRKLTCEHAEIKPIVQNYALWNQANSDEAVAQELLSDPLMHDFAEEEIISARSRIITLQTEIQKMLLPKDQDESRSIFVEIRAGTGGDESALFAGDLLRMYLRYAERQHWNIEIISEIPSDLGGYKGAIIRILGRNAYSRLRFESGGHRVQRIPITEIQGRIHTSTCTVAVMQEVDDIGEIEINSADLRIDTFRASGSGGQHINKTDSAVRVTHIPTGIVVECQNNRSQHKNKDHALKVLASRIREKQCREQHIKETITRKNLIGSGDRSERIRTYNFPQGRITDHRIKLTLYKLEEIMNGNLNDLTTILISEYQAELLTSLGKTG
ncbi:MAG: peptide chain release factor 1 [Burkholderia sp.]|nr:peptide chain release factor 1 [Burkholderia sp.]